jgi:hypothetical protein
MNEPEKVRCEEYSRAIFGKSVKNGDLEELVKGSVSFEEFRIRLVHRFSNKNEHSKRIAARWQDTVVKTNNHSDANILMHMLESLALKQIEIERKLREANADLLARFQALDAAATDHATWRVHLDEIREQIVGMRKNLVHMEELPSRGGNGSK